MSNEFAGHTQGPWHVIQHNHIDGDLWLGIGWTDKDGRKIGPVCDISSKQDQAAELRFLVTPQDEQWANARLIAAAPDLLARAEKAEQENVELRELFLALYDDERGHKRINRKSLLWDRIMRASEEIRALLAGVPS